MGGEGGRAQSRCGPPPPRAGGDDGGRGGDEGEEEGGRRRRAPPSRPRALGGRPLNDPICCSDLLLL